MSRSRSYNLSDGGLYYGELNSSGLPESLNASGIWDDGKRYVGQWKDGKISGVGTMYYPDGKEIYGYWWEGELLHEFKTTSSSTPSPSSPTPAPTWQPSSPNPQENHKVAALLIGNNNYTDKPLNNCIKDAEAIGEELRQIGANVTILRNAQKSEMKAAIKKLSDKASTYENVFFFFSGHGASNQGRHYITAIDESSSETLPISLEEIDEFLSKTDFKNIMLVSDACSVIVQGNGDTTPVVSAGRTLMAFSSSLGSSWDGIPGEHSPFAFGLLQYISKPMNVIEMFQEANKFAMAYAINHNFYQQPVLVIPPFFPIEFYIYS